MTPIPQPASTPPADSRSSSAHTWRSRVGARRAHARRARARQPARGQVTAATLRVRASRSQADHRSQRRAGDSGVGLAHPARQAARTIPGREKHRTALDAAQTVVTSSRVFVQEVSHE